MRGNRHNQANESSRHRGNKLDRSGGRNYLSVAKQRNIFISNTTSYIYLHNLNNLSSQMMGNRTSAQSQSLTMWPQHTLSDSAHPRHKHTHTKKGRWRAGRREGGRAIYRPASCISLLLCMAIWGRSMKTPSRIDWSET